MIIALLWNLILLGYKLHIAYHLKLIQNYYNDHAERKQNPLFKHIFLHF
jgi:hypothetical protein